MTNTKRVREEIDTVPAEQVRREFEDEMAALPPTEPETLEKALDALGDELVRLEVLARRAGDVTTMQRISIAVGMLAYIESILTYEDWMLNDLLLSAEDLRDELDTLPRSKGIDDPWALNPGSEAR